MIHSITRITSLALVFGFFISCSTLSSADKNVSTENITKEELRQQVDSLDTLISSKKATPGLLYKKGFFLTELAQKNDPRQRTSLYTNARQVLNKSSDLYTGNPEGEKAQELLKVTWSHEHNEGVKIMQQDSSLDNPDYELAAAHFNNATLVIPDSSISYKMEARAYYKNQQNQKAINVLEEAQNNIEQLPSPVLEQLAFLYFEDGQTQKAVTVFEKAEAFSDQNLNLLHGLSNAYISAGQHQKAVELLKLLIESKPENIIYKQALATELYYLAEGEIESAASALQNGKGLEETNFSLADSLLRQAENQYKHILDTNSGNRDIKEGFAQFYQNSAAKYQQLLSLVDEENAQPLIDSIERYLSSSIPLLEQLAKQNPDDEQVWKNLYQAYSYLGMQEEAQNAKANF